MEILGFVGIAILVVLAILYRSAPIIVRLNLTHRDAPSFREVDVRENPMPPSVAAFFEDVEAALDPMGLHFDAYLFAEHQTPDVMVFMGVYRNPTQRELASAVAIHAEHAGARYVEISTEFSEGRELNTNNSAEPRVFDNTPKKMALSFPEIQDAAELCRVHRALCDRHFGRPGRWERHDLRAGKLIEESMVRDLELYAAQGYFVHEPERGVYRPTWVGAFLMTWRMLPPLKQIRAARFRATARRMLREAGVDTAEGV